MPHSGIYKITNLANGYLYIGSAVNLSARKRQHFHDLFHNKHANNRLQRAYNKYGCAAFIFEIIEECDKEVLIRYEQYWIDLARNEESKLYNIALIAGNCLGVKRSKNFWTGKKRSKEDRKKFSDSHMGQIGIARKNRVYYPGVTYNKANKNWRCRIAFHKVRKELGSFSNYETAVLVRMQAESAIKANLI